MLNSKYIISSCINEKEKCINKKFQKKIWELLNNIKKNKNNFFNVSYNLKKYKKKCKTKRIFVINSNNLPDYFMSFLEKLKKFFSITILNITPLGMLIKEKNNFIKTKCFDSIKKLKKIIINPLLIYLAKYSIHLIKNLSNKKNKNITKKLENNNTLLGNIQKDIILNKLNTNKIFKHDNSFLIHACCSKYKEVEVLHKNLIKILKKDQDIKLHEIAIVSTNIKKYLPYIKSVFNSPKQKNHILYTTMVNYKSIENIYLKFFYKIFKLKEKEITKNEIFDLLNSNIIKKRYKITNKEIELLKIWTEEVSIRFGIDEKTIKKKYKHISAENTWWHGLKKMILGNTTYSKKIIYENYVPYTKVNYSRSSVLTKLINVIHVVSKWKKTFSKPHKLIQWKKLFKDITIDFFPYKKSYKIKNIENLFIRIIESGIKENYNKKIYINELSVIFKKHIKILQINKNIFLGSIILCNNSDIENINFKLIYFLGIHRHKEKNITMCKQFDITYKKKEYTYYEKTNYIVGSIILLIIAAEKYFYISYIKNFNKNKKTIKIIETLINYISKSYYFNKIYLKNITLNKKNILSKLLQKHKSDISYKNYINNNKKKIVTYKNNNKNHNIINHTNTNTKINIKNLIEFWNSPIKYFLKKVIKINLYKHNINNINTEPFLLNESTKLQISKKIFLLVLKNKNTRNVFKYYCSLGILPKKNFGKIVFKKLVIYSIFLKKKIEKICNKIKIQVINVKIKIRNFIIYTKIQTISSKRLVNYKLKKLSINDKIEFWFYHLFFCLTKQCKHSSILLGYKNSKIIFSKISYEESYNYIVKYFEGYLQGQKKPIFLTMSGMIWIFNMMKSKNKKKSKKKFLKFWEGNYYFYGEKNNIYIKKVIKNSSKKNIKKIYNSSLKWHYPILKNIKKYNK